MKKRALLSVSDKSGIAKLAKGLIQLDYEIVSTGGTAELLHKEGIACIDVSQVTGFGECLDGRVKTLHPKIHASILCDRNNPAHMSFMAGQGIETIDIVVVNLYPFGQAITQVEVTEQQAIDKIDIGGPAMLRSAAKNFDDVFVVCDTNDYDTLLQTLSNVHSIEQDELILFKKRLAHKAFAHTASYDSVVSGWFAKQLKIDYPDTLTLAYDKVSPLRYGENAHQSASFYKAVGCNEGLPIAKILGGKELSFNNINDANAAILLLTEYDTPAVVAIKHTNPCGVATSDDIDIAYQKAYQADTQSIFGGIVGFNRKVGIELAQKLSKLFLELVIAPEFDTQALQILKKKPNLRILQLDYKAQNIVDTKHIAGGLLVQASDNTIYSESDIVVPTIAKLAVQDLQELKFAYSVVKHTKSNAIVITANKATVGIGVGQTSRIKACQQALLQAGQQSKGAYLASDGFFPFDDCVKLAAQYGIKAIMQPGGSKNDKDSIAACDQHGIAMAIVGQRHFMH